MAYLTTDQRFLNSMPESFTRKELIKTVLDAGYSLSKANHILEVATLTGKLERERPGQFRKATA